MRDNCAGMNLLYSRDLSVYRYKDTYEAWPLCRRDTKWELKDDKVDREDKQVAPAASTNSAREPLVKTTESKRRLM